MKKEELHNLIERYFDADLTSREEQELLELLLHDDGDDPEVREAIAVLAAVKAHPMNSSDSSHRKRTGLNSKSRWIRNSINRWSGAVAAILVLITVGVTIFNRSEKHPDGDIIAYMDGVKVEDRTQIINIITSQLEDIEKASEDFSSEVAGDLEELSWIINNEDI